MKLQYVEIEDFMGIQSAKFAVGEGGALFVGKSKSGKTSLANAIYAAIKSKGFGPECICDDADRWRVLLKFNTATVQTTVRRSGSKDVKVDGLGLGSPQAKLDAIFPDLIDPWKLAQDDPDKRRRKVLSAMPAVATAEDMKLWTGDDWTPADGEHGLDVVKKARDHYYGLRTTANKDAEAAELAYKQAQEDAERLASPAHAGVMVPPPGEEDAPVREAEATRRQLDQRKADAEAMARRTQGTREKIAKLRASAAEKIAASPVEITASEIAGLLTACKEVEAEVERLETMLVEARKRSEAAGAAWNEAANRNETRTRHVAQAKEWTDQANDLEASLSAAGIEPPTEDQIAAADQAITTARAHAEIVCALRKAHDAAVAAAALGDEAAAAKDEAKRLDDIVKRLDRDATAELAARAKLIPGLTFVDDDIALDGKVFKILSESEKTELCVDLVKRIAPEAKLLRIDKLEGMDPDMREAFIRKAKDGGWQIIGTVVERGEMRIVIIDADGECEDAPITNVKPAKQGQRRLKIIMPEEGK